MAVLNAGLRRPETSVEKVLAALGARPHARGRVAARRAIECASPKSDSVGESRCRCRLAELGAPVPILQHVFDDSRGRIGPVDFFREQGVVVEFDGDRKYLDERYRGGLSASAVVVKERRDGLALAAAAKQQARNGGNIVYARCVLVRSPAPVVRASPAEQSASLHGERWRRLRQDPRALWTAFGLIHVTVFVLLIPMMLTGQFGGDLPIYSTWATEAIAGGVRPVFDYDWVYPVGALVPVLLPRILGPDLYEVVWLVLITAANATSLVALIRWGRRLRDQTAAGWWVLILGILSPVDLLRLEGFTAPAVVLALLFLATRPRVSGLLLAAATWIKVWPAAVVVAVIVASTRRWAVVVMGALVSAVIILVVVLGGGGSHLLSFVNEQDGRPLQIEAPLATPWLWMAVLHVRGAVTFHDTALITQEVTGPGDWWVVANGTMLMLAVMAAIVVLLAVATRRLRALPHVLGRETDLVLIGALSLAAAFIVFNKVGSPQYMLWLAPIVAVGLVLRPPDWKTPAILMLGVAVLTTIVFPTFYFALMALNPEITVVLGIRNLLLVVILAWSVSKLFSAAFVRQPVPLSTRPFGTSVRSTSY